MNPNIFKLIKHTRSFTLNFLFFTSDTQKPKEKRKFTFKRPTKIHYHTTITQQPVQKIKMQHNSDLIRQQSTETPAFHNKQL